MARSSSADPTRLRIRAAARTEIVDRGVLGLRVAQVATRAECSIATIYLHFGDRIGLLAEVLLDIYTEELARRVDGLRTRLGSKPSLTPAGVVQAMVGTITDSFTEMKTIRSQMMIVAASDATLQARVAECSGADRNCLEELFDDIDSRLKRGHRLDREVSHLLLSSIEWHYDDVLGRSDNGEKSLHDVVSRSVVRR